MNGKKFDTVDAVNEIIANAGALQTLLDCIHSELAITPIKREMMGKYTVFYEGDVRRVDDLLYAAGKLIYEIEDFGNGLYADMSAASSEGGAAV